MSQSPYERVSDSNLAALFNTLGWDVSIPLRTGLGFEQGQGVSYDDVGQSQSPYERVSDSNRGVCVRPHHQPSLNPLTNGSRIRTRYSPKAAVRVGVSIPLRTGLGFEHHPRPARVRRARRLNPLTNGSRIRTVSAAMWPAPGLGLNPLTNGSRIRTGTSRMKSGGTFRLNPLTNGSRIRTATE